MVIRLDENYNAMTSTALIGYVGETNARPVSVEGMEIDGADRYVLTIDYGDGVTYEVDITGGTWTPTADILRSAQTVSCQICAKKLSGQEYILLKKSRIFRLRIGAAIGDNAIPSPDVSVDALDRIDAIGRQAHADMQTAVTAAETATTSAENAEKSATTAGVSADTATQAASRAETAKTAAETSATQAETAKQGAENARAEAVTAQNAAKVSADLADSAVQQTTADKTATAGYAQTAKTNADSTTADRQAVQTLAEQVTADKVNVTENAAKVAEDRTAAETAAQTAQAVADSLPDDYVTTVGKIAENTAEINNTNTEVSELKGDLVELDNRFIITPNSSNRFDVSKTVQGILLNNVLVAHDTFWTSGYVDVSGCEIIRGWATKKDDGTRTSIPLYYLTTFDENKNMIAYKGSYTSSRYTVEENVKYIRFAYGESNYEQVCIFNGENDLGFSEYSETITLKNCPYISEIPKVWQGKKWTCIGDSLTAINDKTTKHYYDYISEKTGITVQNLAISGSGYAKKQDTNEAFYQRILLTDLDADVVTIFGSFNDSSADLPYGTIDDIGTDTYYGCVNKAIDNLYSILPMARLGIIAPTPWESVNPYTRTQNNYVDMLKNVCEKRGIPFLDLYHTSGLRPWEESFRQLAYSKDNGSGVHPDETGQLLFSPRVQKFLEELLLH